MLLKTGSPRGAKNAPLAMTAGDLMEVSITETKTRREKLLKQLQHDEIIVIFAAAEIKTGYSYRQDSNFYYLTAFPEPEAAAVLSVDGGSGSYILFNRAGEPILDVWYGDAIGQNRACDEFMADESFAITSIDTLLPQLLFGKSKIYTNVGFFSESGFHDKLVNWISSLPSETRPQLVDINRILSEMRLLKSDYEIAKIRKACEISMCGHLRAMQRCILNNYEFELSAELLYEFIRLGGQRPAFPTIVASGTNSCILHCADNNKKLIAGDLIVVDAGVEYDHYAADIARTYPVNGIFTGKQTVIYELVLAAQKAVIKEIKPGITWNHLQDTADRVITDGLVKLGFLAGDVSELIATGAHKKFTLHKIGHWLGLDVHDVGSYEGDKMWRKLEPGMVFTVEPGVYLGQYALKEVDCDKEWYNMGVRIEDDILVTENGCEVLTSALPKEIADIEYIMAGSS